MNNTITVTETHIKVGNKTVATITGDESYETLCDALYNLLRKDESVYLALYTLSNTPSRKDGVRTSEVANFLSMDRSNCTKALERLLDAGRIKVVGTTADNDETELGRPSRLWLA